MVRTWVSHLRGALSAHLGPAPRWQIDALDYDTYWKDRGAEEPAAPDSRDLWDYPRFVAMASVLARSERVLDIGCGDGAFLAFLRERGFERLVGVDTSHFAVDALLRAGFAAHRCSLEEINFETLPDADVAVLSEVLEHVVGFEAMLATVASHVPRVLISHPNIAYWPHRLRLLTGRFPIQWGWHPGEHVRFLSLTDLLEHLARAGYEVMSLQTPIGVPSPRLRRLFPNLMAEHVILEVRLRSLGHGS